MRIEADALKLDGLEHGFFTRQGGVSKGIYESLNIGLGSDDVHESVTENRDRVADSLGVSAEMLVSPYQTHSSDVITLSGPWAEGTDRKADALVTNTPGLAIGVSTADCGPVLFADPLSGILAAAHSGWKGAITGILQNTVAAMEALGADRNRIIAVLGPTISQKAYEVGPEFQQRFTSYAATNGRFFAPSERTGHFMFDLPAFITGKLQEIGVAQIIDIALCTYGDENRFFSYRRTTHRNEPDYGRQISAIALV